MRLVPGLAAAGAAAFLAATAVTALLVFGSAAVAGAGSFAFTTAALAPAVLVGCLVTWRASRSPVGPALCWLGAAPAVVEAVEAWGGSFLRAHPWPGAGGVFVLKQGFWVWNLTGFVALCLVFPDGLLPGRFWKRLPALAFGAAAVLNAAESFYPSSHRVGGVTRVGYALHLPRPLALGELALAFALFLFAVVATVASVVVRYRRAGEIARLQLRWLMLSSGAVPVLLVAGWLAGVAGLPTRVWAAGFMLAMLVAVPVAVAVAILRYDLYDIDRLLGSSLAWVMTTVVSAALFAFTVYVIGEAADASSRISVTTAAFVTALLLLPLHRSLHQRIGGLFDREPAVIESAIADFVIRVRDGRAEPEGIVALLRLLLRDPELRLVLRVPGDRRSEYVDADGRAMQVPSGTQIPLVSNGVELGLIVLGTSSVRRDRLARAAVSKARLPIEVARLRIELRRALAEAESSRTRLLEAATAERRRLERDLHDGAQQQILAVGMRLRSLQSRLSSDTGVAQELDAAVGALESIVGELRRLAHGVRPGRLEDGLGPALRALVAESPIPVELSVADVALSDVAATTAYFVVAEALANALKHANATQLFASVARENGRALVEIRDNGVGGAQPGFGLTSLKDRVAAAGGSLTISSPPGAGTRLVAELACAS